MNFNMYNIGYKMGFHKALGNRKGEVYTLLSAKKTNKFSSFYNVGGGGSRFSWRNKTLTTFF